MSETVRDKLLRHVPGTREQIAATSSGWSGTQITVTVPSGAITGNVVLTVAGVSATGRFLPYSNRKSETINKVAAVAHWNTNRTSRGLV